jgi:hypothetical protein
MTTNFRHNLHTIMLFIVQLVMNKTIQLLKKFPTLPIRLHKLLKKDTYGYYYWYTFIRKSLNTRHAIKEDLGVMLA